MRAKSQYLYPIIAVGIVVLLWDVLTRTLNVSPIVFPGPTLVVDSIRSNWENLLQHSMLTYYVALMGFVISTILSFLLTTLFHFSKPLKIALFPLAVSTRAIPIVALAPIVVLWFGTGNVSKVFLSSLISFFPILINQMKGIADFEKDEFDLLKTFTTNKWRIYFKVRIPNSLPYLFAGFKVATAFAVIGSIVAEFVGSNNGIGYIVKSSTYYNDTPLTFASIVFAALIGLSFYEIIAFVERRIVFWDQSR